MFGAFVFAESTKRGLFLTVVLSALLLLTVPPYDAAKAGTPAEKGGNTVKLLWATAGDSNDHYKVEIQRTGTAEGVAAPAVTYDYSQVNSCCLVVEDGYLYSVRIQTVDEHGVASEFSEAASFTFDAVGKPAFPSSATPVAFSLSQNYPNPFNASTTLSFSLPHDTFVKLVIYNITGQKVAEVLNSHMASGVYAVSWHPENLPSGTYLYRLETDSYKQTRKMSFLK